MFERYSERARRVIFFARYEASCVGSMSIDTGHLLLGLLREGPGPDGDALRSRGLTHDSVTRWLRARTMEAAPTPTSVDLPLSVAARQSLERASEEADRLEAPVVETPHLLLGLLHQSDATNLELLAPAGLRLQEYRDEVRLRSRSRPPSAASAGAFGKLAQLLAELERRHAPYLVLSRGPDAVRVQVGLPDQPFIATFFADGRVRVEPYSAGGVVEDEGLLARLVERLGPGSEDPGGRS